VQVLEGPWDYERCVVIEFPDVDAARGWYESDEYAPLKVIRQGASDTQMVLVAGPEQRAG